MSDYILIEGDQAVFIPAFGAAVVVVRPGFMSASGPATISSKKICVEGDEAKLSVPGCTYIAGPYTIPGVGTLKIDRLAGNQKANKTDTGGKAVLLKGGSFQAKFEVQSPAMQPLTPPAVPVPDTMVSYPGSGRFINTNFKIRGI